ncbi:MAG: ribonuclease Y [Phycisphaerales bacterium]|nr:ribonuclease Y [Phycisphaerales bacterium]
MTDQTGLVELTFVETLIIAAALLVGLVGGGLVIGLLTGRSLRRAKELANEMIRSAEVVASDKAKDIQLTAERDAASRRTEVDREVKAALQSVQESQVRSQKVQETLERKFEQIEQREERTRQREDEARGKVVELEAERTAVAREREQASRRLSEIAGLSRDEAREIFLEDVRANSAHEAATVEQKIIAEAEARATERSREITLMAIQRYAADVVSESTIKTVKIPSEDMKGRIIGREGRNIKAIEKLTGVDILVDDTPGIISVSCFDRVRQAIAAETLQRLVADGRVHPTRVEEVVEQVRRDITQRVVQAGTEAALEADIRNLNPKIIEAMGKLSFRTSFGQNVLKHSLEVAFLSQLIADQLGLDGAIARRAGFLHDIGKAMDHESEGGHPAIGMEFAARHGEKNQAVLNAIGGHHSDIPSSTPYTPIVMAADALSGARPGARRESMELYIKRLEQLEAIAYEQPNVTEAFAVQAGREVRVIVNAGKVDDATTHMIASAIARRVEQEMTFPGEIKVSVLREVRAEATAR